MYGTRLFSSLSLSHIKVGVGSYTFIHIHVTNNYKLMHACA